MATDATAQSPGVGDGAGGGDGAGPVTATGSVDTVRLEYFSWLGKELIGAGEEGRTVAVPLLGDRTVRSLLVALADDSEAFARLVYDRDGQRIREYATLILNGRVIELAGGLDAPLRPDDHLLLLPGFSGG